MLSVTPTGLQHFEINFAKHRGQCNLKLTVNEDLQHCMEVLKWEEFGSRKIFCVCNMLDRREICSCM
jgi:hypothetical protein